MARLCYELRESELRVHAAWVGARGELDPPYGDSAGSRGR